MGSFLIWIVVCLLLNSFVSFIVTALGGNYYLATMICSLVLALLVAIMNTRADRRHFYRQRFFWVTFLATALVLLLLDMLLFVLQG